MTACALLFAVTTFEHFVQTDMHRIAKAKKFKDNVLSYITAYRQFLSPIIY